MRRFSLSIFILLLFASNIISTQIAPISAADHFDLGDGLLKKRDFDGLVIGHPKATGRNPGTVAVNAFWRLNPG
jgi:hypothetical protein